MEKSAMTPSVERSSGTNPTPASSTSATDLPTSSIAVELRRDPATGVCSPRIASVSSVWPLPWTPAIDDDLAAGTSKRDVVDAAARPPRR